VRSLKLAAVIGAALLACGLIAATTLAAKVSGTHKLAAPASRPSHTSLPVPASLAAHNKPAAHAKRTAHAKAPAQDSPSQSANVSGHAKVSCANTRSDLTRLNPAAGTVVSLKRGCRYTGPLTLRADNVTVTAYGAGSDPVITLDRNGATVRVYGSHDTVENLSLQGVAPGTWSCGGGRTPAGHVDGVDLEPGSADNVVSDVAATGFYAAVFIYTGSDGNTVTSSTFIGNVEMNRNSRTQSAGGYGVLLHGDNNIIENNTINDNQACSNEFGRDGSAVEVYGGSHNLIRGNQGANDAAFTELGSPPGSIATGNTYIGNTVTDGTGDLRVIFLITRGSGNVFGPVSNTVVEDNRVILTRPGDKGAVSYAWRPGNGIILTLTGNDLDLGGNTALFEDGGYIDGGGNAFIGGCNPSRACLHSQPN
jgi:hypothetical protein